jgi:hypothetical protein
MRERRKEQPAIPAGMQGARASQFVLLLQCFVRHLT